MKPYTLSDEEAAIINQFRQEKLLTQQQQQQAEIKQSLEEKFYEERNKVIKLITSHLAAAEFNLELAVQVSEQTGIPFRSFISKTDVSRSYLPHSFHNKWDDLNRETLYDLEICQEDDGWEYWRTSALTC